ncbi:MAG TPA: Cu(I)-responsive transcriptional regulator [Stellaceae bacterium]|nr:Cu(I)-responsive transcriptional regulator [Stellaceae bacterium]
MKANALMTIGEAASRSGMPPKTIRFYEEIGLIAPAERLDNGYRAYDETDVHTLRFIHRARSLGFTLEDIRALLSLYRDRRRASREVKRLALQHVAALDRKIAELTAVRNAIAELAERCAGNDRPECPILDDLGATTH